MRRHWKRLAFGFTVWAGLLAAIVAFLREASRGEPRSGFDQPVGLDS